ncbi:hypothetical protein DRQ25_00375 [Candidatus Fermentibacteria bacterium]|nr:MAG: hypothetical protein DRQ25_00375 [Candidatus Fermentibacteria bacterium]
MMDSWNNLGKTGKVLLFLVLGAILYAAVSCFLPFDVSQMAVLSLSNVNYLTDDPAFHGKSAWLVNFVVFGGGQYLKGTTSYVTPEAIASEVGHARKGFTFTVENMYDFCDYRFEKSAQLNQYTILWKKLPTDFLFTPGGATGACANDGGGYILVANDLHVWCIRKEIVGYVGSIPTPRERWSTQMTLKVDGRSPITETISSADETSATFGNIGHVSWVGSLWTGMQCPVFGDKIPVFHDVWRIANKDTYRDYLFYWNQVERDIRECGHLDVSPLPAFCNAGTLARDINEANKKARVLTCSDEKIHGTQRIVGDTATIAVTQPIAAPSFTLRLLADELGIAYHLPEPEIIKDKTYCDPDNTEASGGTLYVGVRNKASQAGAITTVVSCEDTEIAGYTPRQMYDAKEMKILSIPLTLTETIKEDIETKCTVTAYASEKSDVLDKYTFYCGWKNFVGCTPKARMCSEDNKYVVECSMDGKGWAPIESCRYGCVNGVCGTEPTKCSIMTHEPCEGDETCIMDSMLNTYCKQLKCRPNQVARDHECTTKPTIDLPILWMMIFAATGFLLGKYLIESMNLTEARRRMALILIAAIFALIPVGMDLAGMELPDIQSGFLTCEATESFPFQIAAMLGLPLGTFMWFLSLGLGLISGLVAFSTTRNMNLGRTTQATISSIVAVITWKTICTTFWIGILFGGIIAVVGVLLLAFFPEAVAGWGLRFAKGMK